MTKSENTNPETVEKKSLKERVLAPIKKHPKIAIAIAAGVTLVAGTALLTKNDPLDAPAEESDDEVSLTPES
jgi:hypothetical protein